MTRQASSFRVVSTLLLAGATLVLPSPAGHAVPRIPATCGPNWSVESSPNFRGDHSNLQAVSAFSPTGVWAVGNHFLDFMHPFKTLAEHWDGNAWAISPTPNRGSGGNFLFGVDTLSDAEAWAVGQSRNGDGTTFTLVERWEGNAWSIVPTPQSIG